MPAKLIATANRVASRWTAHKAVAKRSSSAVNAGGSRADSLRGRLHRRPRPHLVQPRGTRDCCERHNDAGQQQRPPAGHADRLNGASSMYCYLLSLVAAVYPSVSGAVNRGGGETDLRALQTCALMACRWTASRASGQRGSQVGASVNRPPSAKPIP